MLRLFLARDGLNVARLTQEGVAHGETMRTSAHLTAGPLDRRYFRLEMLHGELGARLAAESHTAAIDRIEEIVHREHIDCGFARVDGDPVADLPEAVEYIEREAEAARLAGLPVEKASFSPGLLQGPGPCLRFPHQAQFHPLRFLAAVGGPSMRSGDGFTRIPTSRR